jgi:hypothetical protein
MKKRIPILLALTISVLMLAGPASVGAGAARKVTGSFQWWFPGFHGWSEINIHEVAPEEAEGEMSVKEYREELGWRRWKGHAICIAFGETKAGQPTASWVVQIDRISGWGPGPAGQYAKFWASDGGSPATKDKVGLIVWPPVDKQPDCGYRAAPPPAQWPPQAGELAIHH